MPGPSNIFLVGPMGSGKSAVGVWLSKRLELPFADSDAYIEQETGVDISRIFDIEGEEGFREREEQAIGNLCSRQGLVLATGGGAVLRADNRRALRSNGTVFYLQCSLDEQVERTRSARNRPLLEQGPRRQVLKKLLTLREPLYREVADHVVDTNGLEVRQVGRNIIRLLNRA
ncbi:MAG: shikimate kinase AroK [Gammaproteobacteria bacterium]|nr:shikimate kinase AroK [Gammaproteobacteria bacterium]MCY4254680.1 shikimate kinase AroK [Gammaproteobacteria bacterium]